MTKVEYSELLQEWEILKRYVLRINEEYPFDCGSILAAVEMKIKVLKAELEAINENS